MDKILLAAIFAAGLVLCTGPLLIPELHKLKFGQSIREEGPKSHQAKSGTPTMGGIMIILAIVIATVAAAPLTPAVLLALFITLGHFVLGFLDDYIKVVKKRNLGLKAKQKMLGQILIAIVTMIVGTRVLGIDTTIWIPIADINLDIFMGDTGSLALGGAIAAVGILTHTEILLAVIGFVFVCEALSVIIQVISFKTTGKRVFRMSPIHHHFELGGWKETKVVFVFWMVGLVASVVGLLMMP